MKYQINISLKEGYEPSLDEFKKTLGHAFKRVPPKERDKVIKEYHKELVPSQYEPKKSSRRAKEDRPSEVDGGAGINNQGGAS